MQLLEESQEARNKDFRRFREPHSKKSLISTNIDLLNMLLVTSDPVITSHKEVWNYCCGNQIVIKQLMWNIYKCCGNQVVIKQLMSPRLICINSMIVETSLC